MILWVAIVHWLVPEEHFPLPMKGRAGRCFPHPYTVENPPEELSTASVELYVCCTSELGRLWLLLCALPNHGHGRPVMSDFEPFVAHRTKGGYLPLLHDRDMYYY